MTDSDIIELYMRRDERAIAETQKIYGKYCEKVARNILGDEQEARECVNDTYLKAWENIPPERPQSLAAYLAKLTRNGALSRYRHSTAGKRGGETVPLILDELSEIVSDGSSVEKTAENHEIISEINRFLETLPETSRRIFVLRYICCESVRSIAQRFGIRENSVSVNLNRTKKQLKKHLNKEGYDL
ncbi:MAG: sigma-70 family RNA polymerase sigma factor [Oscillospiraceae bacterium]|nr:sigma-70 family RNA polymerase sigma factor [Oscillospiraceae bacterium]